MWGTYWRLRLAYGLAVSIFLLGLTLFGWHGDSLSAAHYDKIKTDMTMEDVEEILSESGTGGEFVHGAKMKVDDDGDFVVEDGAMKWEQSGKSITVTFRD